MRHHQRGQVSLASDPADQAHEFDLVVDVEIGRELVQQEYLRLLRNCASKQQALFLPSGNLRNPRIQVGHQSSHFQRLHCDLFILCSFETHERQVRRPPLHGELEDSQRVMGARRFEAPSRCDAPGLFSATLKSPWFPSERCALKPDAGCRRAGGEPWSCLSRWVR